MATSNRRVFLADVGRGMLVASLGAATAIDLGLSHAIADEASARLTFGPFEGLASLIQETPPQQLMPLLVERLKRGESLQTLTAAGALANARAFGGQDYTGYHTFMALAPALRMAQELPLDRQALPVLKVIYRNANRIQETRHATDDTLHPLPPSSATNAPSEAWLRDAVRKLDWNVAEERLAALIRRSPDEAYQEVLLAIQDEANVHRVVLAWRAWAMLSVAGEANAETMLRQSVRFCLEEEEHRQRQNSTSELRAVLPELLDRYKLVGRPTGNRPADDQWVDRLALTIFVSSRAQAADAVAAALAEGFDPEAIGEAISLAANRLLLHDPGRRVEHSTPIKPAGCVHGDSVGVHASDSANAWRNIARVGNQRNRVASLIVGAYHTAGQTEWVTERPYPFSHLVDNIREQDAAKLLSLAEESIRAKEQARVCAIVQRYGDLGHSPRPLFDLLLKYAVSEDGALHAEKFYSTVSEEFATTRPSMRWRQLIALARVTSSEYGFPADGYSQLCDLLKIS